MKKVLMFLLCVSIAVSVSAQNSPEKAKDIRKVMEISGAGVNGVQVMETMVGQFKQALPDVPDEFWKEAMKEVSADALIDLIVPIYDKHFTHAEIKQLIAFYETPVGKKLSTTLPLITQEAMAAGQKWGEEIGQSVVEKLRKKGYIKE
jgi:uncharacterized protein